MLLLSSCTGAAGTSGDLNGFYVQEEATDQVRRGRLRREPERDAEHTGRAEQHAEVEAELVQCDGEREGEQPVVDEATREDRLLAAEPPLDRAPSPRAMARTSTPMASPVFASVRRPSKAGG